MTDKLAEVFVRWFRALPRAEFERRANLAYDRVGKRVYWEAAEKAEGIIWCGSFLRWMLR